MGSEPISAQPPQSAWLNDFLGTDQAEKPDLAKATALTVKIKAGDSEDSA